MTPLERRAAQQPARTKVGLRGKRTRVIPTTTSTGKVEIDVVMCDLRGCNH